MKFKKIGQFAIGCYSAMLSVSATAGNSTDAQSADRWIAPTKSEIYLAGNHFNNTNNTNHNNNSGGHNNNHHNHNVNHQNYAYNNSSGTQRSSFSMFS